MNVIFLTLVRISDIEERGIYQDLMRKFRDEGHKQTGCLHSIRVSNRAIKLIQSNKCSGQAISLGATQFR